MVLNLAPLGVIAYGTALALLGEFVAYMFIYKTSNFQTLKQGIEKHTTKLDAAKEASTSKNVKKKEQRLAGWEDAVSKQIASIQFRLGIIVSSISSMQSCTAHVLYFLALTGRPSLSAMQTMATMLISYRVVPYIFGSKPVGLLPYSQPAFMLALTQRGMDGADPRECSAVRFSPSQPVFCPTNATDAPVSPANNSNPRFDSLPLTFSSMQFFLFMLCQGSIRTIVNKALGLGLSRRMAEIRPSWAKMKQT